MSDFFRTYNTLKLFYKRKTEVELEELATSNIFEYRVVFLDDCECLLHMIFSWRWITKWGAIALFGFLVILGYKSLIGSLILALSAIILFVLSKYLNKRYYDTALKYVMTKNLYKNYIEHYLGATI
jgi:hypothetical protein